MSAYRASGALSLILLTYVKPLEDIDAAMPDHVAWLTKGFDEGAFVIAGRRAPRTGGVILVRGDADTATAVAKTDPFVTGGVATFEIVAFNASFAVPEVKALLA